MKILSKEKIKVVAERNGWSLPRAEGFVDGESFRRRAKTPSAHMQIGIDEYSQGFRAGYYERRSVDSTADNSRTGVSPVLPQSLDRNEYADIAVISAQTG